MSTQVSLTTGNVYGLQRVCRVCQFARSTLYAQKQRAMAPEMPTAKRGLKALYSDKDLLALIRANLEQSLFLSEGHCKVWACQTYGASLSVGRKRVLRLLREHNLLSPRRQSQVVPNEHNGEITTQAPNVMWGVDGTKVFTVEDGYVWIFTAMEHWNGQSMGWHVAEKGDRFATLKPVKQAVLDQFGSVGPDMARGLALRMDHDTQYLSDHFQSQLMFWGIALSCAFLEQPRTHGVAKRYFRTRKEQVVYGKVFRTPKDVRRAVGDFIECYNREGCLDKNGYLSPRQMGDAWVLKEVA